MPRVMPEAVRHASADEQQVFEVGAHVTSVHFVGEQAAAALGDGTARFATWGKAQPSCTQVCEGVILCACLAPDGTALLAGSDDGGVFRVSPRSTELIARKTRWIDALASHTSGAIAFASTRRATVRRADGSETDIETPSRVDGLIFAPDGDLAIAHLGGVTVASFTSPDLPNKTLSWTGRPISITVAPDNRFIVVATYENALHGWRRQDGTDMHMSGYSRKPNSLAWSPDGAWLATSGARRIVLWPFDGPDGPMARKALTLRPRDAVVTAVTCHPISDLIAAGYDDGAVALARRSAGTLAVVRPPDGHLVTSVSFHKAGHLLAFGTERGTFGMIKVEPQ